MVFLFLTFWGASIIFFIVSALFCILTSGVQRFQFLHIIDLGCPCFFFFNNSHPDRCEVIAHYSFDLISLMINDSEHLFHIPIGHLYAFFEKMSIQVYSPVLIKSLFFCCWVVGASYIFWILILLSDAWFINTVSHFIGSCFTLFSLLCRNFLVWCNPTCLLLLSLQPQKTINS